MLINQQLAFDCSNLRVNHAETVQLTAACEGEMLYMIGQYFRFANGSPELERIAEESLGKPKNGTRWMEFQIDDDTHSPVVLFHYPSNEARGFEYLRRSVKIEFGSLTDQSLRVSTVYDLGLQKNFQNCYVTSIAN